MKRQVFVIHGGNVFASYEDFISYIKEKPVQLEDLLRTDWKKSLQESLGEGYAVYPLQMPNKQNANYEEWKLWFEKYIPFFEDGVIFVGHSLGGIFLAKYFEENTIEQNIGGLFLVAPPYKGTDLSSFSLSDVLPNVQSILQKVRIYHSTDDVVVPINHLEKYKQALPGVSITLFDDRGHFNGVDFPEIVKDIQSL